LGRSFGVDFSEFGFFRIFLDFPMKMADDGGDTAAGHRKVGFTVAEF
jgi:hypothetical protein